MTDLSCDVAVIGAGTAGLAAERSARAAGATTLLIDDRFAGTTCATVGCMPSKLLIAAAKAAHDVDRASVFGIDVPGYRVDGAAVMARVRARRDEFVAGALRSISEVPDDRRIRSRARFVGPTTLMLEDGRHISARAVVIATGAQTQVPEPFEALGELMLTNETIFDLIDLPASIAVVGAGPLGLELAQALSRLGVDVSLFNRTSKLAGLKDDAVAGVVKAIVARDMTLHLGVEIEPRREGGQAVLRWHGDDGVEGEQAFDRVLVATGRPPNLEGLGLHAAGLNLDERGVPHFDRRTMQCGNAAVFIAGDADADVPVLHEASDEGAIAGGNAARWPDMISAVRSIPFAVTFTDPPIAVVGAPAQADDVVGCSSYGDQGTAKLQARAEGLVRLYAARSDGRLTGAAMVGPGMDHIAHLLAWAIERGETAGALLDLPFYHPTLEEGLKAGLREICHVVQAHHPFGRDGGAPPGG